MCGSCNRHVSLRGDPSCIVSKGTSTQPPAVSGNRLRCNTAHATSSQRKRGDNMRHKP